MYANIPQSFSFIFKEKYISTGLFLIYFLLAFNLLSGMPSGWDEINNIGFGDYAKTDALVFIDDFSAADKTSGREHGTSLIGTFVLFESLLGYDYQTEPDKVVKLRHTIIFVLFFISVVCFYFFLRNYFKNWIYALLGSLFLVLHPRIFNHSFHNAYDIGMLAGFVISFFTMSLFIRKRNLSTAMLHGIATAFLNDIRIQGVIIVFFTFICFMFIYYEYRNQNKPNFYRAPLLIYLLSTILFTYLFWPFLWGAPIDNFLWAFKEMSNIKWMGTTLFNGVFIDSQSLPWEYNFVWIGITTPIFILVLFGLGIVKFSMDIIKGHEYLNASQMPYILVALWLAIPILLPLVSTVSLYDGWRHHFFIYPAIVFFSVVGVKAFCSLRTIQNKSYLKMFSKSAIVILLISSMSEIFFLHPYSNLYFNSIYYTFNKKTALEHKFDMDYWGLTYKEGLEYLLKTHEGSFTVNALTPIIANIAALPPEDRKRIKVSRQYNQVDYFLTNFRWRNHNDLAQYGDEIYSMSVYGIKVMSIAQSKIKKL